MHLLVFIIFMMIRQMNRLSSLKAPEDVPAAAPITPEDVLLLREIRDSLRNKG